MAEVKQIDQTLKGDKKNVERRAYYYKNQKKILAYQSNKLECECGSDVSRSGIYRHRHSKKHASRMEAIEKMGFDKDEEEEEEDDEDDEEIVLKKGDIDFYKKCNKICICCGIDITSITKGVAQTKKGFICEDC